MIEFNASHVEMSLAVAAALVAFASSDATRPHLGVGIDSGAIGATDGHAACVFETASAKVWEAARPADHNGVVWTRAHVETAIKMARAQKLKTIGLAYKDASRGFPPLAAVMPQPGCDVDQPIGFNPELVGRLTKLVKACDALGARLTSARRPLDPLGFTVASPGGLTAHAAVMPMRV
jgi:hypothetical protein